MRKTTANSLFAVVFAGLVIGGGGLLTGCHSAYQQESVGQYIDNTVITTEVKTKLLADKHVNGLPITVKSYKNTVQLSGFVNTFYQKARAVAIAKSVKGVTSVEDGLVVKKR